MHKVPKPKKSLKVLSMHGDNRKDFYYWMRDDKRKDKKVLLRYPELFRLFALIPKFKTGWGDCLTLFQSMHEQRSASQLSALDEQSCWIGRQTELFLLPKAGWTDTPTPGSRGDLEACRLIQRIMLALKKPNPRPKDEDWSRCSVTETSKSRRSDCSMSSRFKLRAFSASKPSMISSRWLSK